MRRVIGRMQEKGEMLDYVIGDEEVWERVERVKVEDKIELDHFPVVV